VLADLRLRGGVGLHLEQQRMAVGQQPLLVGVPHRVQALALRRRRGGLAKDVPDVGVTAVDAGQEQLALGAVEPEQIGLGDPRLAGDVLGRRAVVAALGEVTEGDPGDLLATVLG
jgi:hypothetical protein